MFRLVLLLVLAVSISAALSSSALASKYPRCFGAASLDPERRCVNPALRLMVSPAPGQAEQVGHGAERNLGLCFAGLRNEPTISEVCDLGRRAAPATLALIGDSHSAQWRPALRVAAYQMGRHAVSLVKSGCDFASPAQPRMSGDAQAGCDLWRSQVVDYLSAHPRIRTVLFASLAHSGSGEEQGYASAWRALPLSVKRIGVIRDSPHTFSGVDQCLRQAISRREAPGPACALSPDQAVRPDAAFSAARDFKGRDARALDFSSFFCRQSCYPVVGGALVYADGNHQTRVFNRSLAPYLLRYLRRAWPGLMSGG